MYDCKQCGGRGFIRQFKREPMKLYPADALVVKDMAPTEEVLCPNCGGLRQRTEYGGGSYLVRGYEAQERVRQDREGFERHALETAARHAFEALLRHGAFVLERPNIEAALEADPMADVEYRARMAVIMPDAHDYFADRIEGAKLEGENAILDRLADYAERMSKGDMHGPTMAFGMRGFIDEVKRARQIAAHEARLSRAPSEQTTGTEE